MIVSSPCIFSHAENVVDNNTVYSVSSSVETVQKLYRAATEFLIKFAVCYLWGMNWITFGRKFTLPTRLPFLSGKIDIWPSQSGRDGFGYIQIVPCFQNFDFVIFHDKVGNYLEKCFRIFPIKLIILHFDQDIMSNLLLKTRSFNTITLLTALGSSIKLQSYFEKSLSYIGCDERIKLILGLFCPCHRKTFLSFSFNAFHRFSMRYWSYLSLLVNIFPGSTVGKEPLLLDLSGRSLTMDFRRNILL